MLPIRSIVIFNGGAGGDFLKMICCHQLYPDFNFALTPTGMVDFDHHYFKFITERLFNSNDQHINVDYGQVWLVDNSHYYLESYSTMAEQLFFIDYPDTAAEFIVTLYKEKRLGSNHELFFNKHYNLLPDNLKKYATEENILQIVSKQWLKQLKIWRENALLTPIQLADFFDKTKLKTICETLMGCPIRDQQLFESDVNNWLEKNQKLVKFFSTY